MRYVLHVLWALAIAALVSGLAMVAGCVATDPGLGIASMEVSPSAVRVGGRATVTARLERNGEPVPGHGIGFTIADTTVANFTSANAAGTNAAGEASVEVIGVGSGATSISAADITTPGSTAQATVTLTVQRVMPAGSSG